MKSLQICLCTPIVLVVANGFFICNRYPLQALYVLLHADVSPGRPSVSPAGKAHSKMPQSTAPQQEITIADSEEALVMYRQHGPARRAFLDAHALPCSSANSPPDPLCSYVPATADASSPAKAAQKRPASASPGTGIQGQSPSQAKIGKRSIVPADGHQADVAVLPESTAAHDKQAKHETRWASLADACAAPQNKTASTKLYLPQTCSVSCFCMHMHAPYQEPSIWSTKHQAFITQQTSSRICCFCKPNGNTQLPCCCQKLACDSGQRTRSSTCEFLLVTQIDDSGQAKGGPSVRPSQPPPRWVPQGLAIELAYALLATSPILTILNPLLPHSPTGPQAYSHLSCNTCVSLHICMPPVKHALQSKDHVRIALVPICL